MLLFQSKCDLHRNTYLWCGGSQTYQRSNESYVLLGMDFISPHTSVWETICDARASRVWHGQICAHFAKNTNSQFDYPHWVLTTQEYPPPPPPNENLVRSWHFEFWLPKNTPPQPLENWTKGLQLECVETNRCIPQGYRLILMVTTKYGSTDNAGTVVCPRVPLAFRPSQTWINCPPW